MTCPFDEGPIHYLDGRTVPTTASARSKPGPYHVDSLRDEFATYDYSSGLYEGTHQLNPPDEDYEDSLPEPVYIVGSWDAFGETCRVGDECLDVVAVTPCRHSV